FFLIESHRDRFRFRDYRYERIGWVVDSVTETDRVEEVFCPRVPGTESFVLEDWLHTAQCPFCGAGQQVGRSDGTIECGFCEAHYTVQVQPNHSAAPQTIDGVPHTPPEMPGERPVKAPEDEDPFERAPEPELEPGEEDDGPLENDNPFTEQSDDDDEKPPFLSSRQYRVGKHVLSEDDYLRHIALKFAGNGRDRVLEAVRQSRGR